jgi:hypothetical protein
MGVSRIFCLPTRTAIAAQHVSELVRQYPDGDVTMNVGVFGVADFAHATSTELYEDPIMGHGLTDHRKFSTSIRS